MTTKPLKFSSAADCLNLWRVAMRFEKQEDVQAFNSAMRDYAALYSNEQNKELLEALKVQSDGLNTITDNHQHWSYKMLVKHAQDLRLLADTAIANAEGEA